MIHFSDAIGITRLLQLTDDPLKPVEYYGKEASEFNAKLVQGKNSEGENQRGKKLAYVYLEDGAFVNAGSAPIASSSTILPYHAIVVKKK